MLGGRRCWALFTGKHDITASFVLGLIERGIGTGFSGGHRSICCRCGNRDGTTRLSQIRKQLPERLRWNHRVLRSAGLWRVVL